MLKSRGQKAVEQLLNHIDLLSKRSPKRENDLVTKFLAEAKEQNEFYEWGLAMENLLVNIYEIDFPIDTTTLELTKIAVKECQMDYSKFAFIEELVPGSQNKE